jgi:hypothetical protein
MLMDRHLNRREKTGWKGKLTGRFGKRMEGKLTDRFGKRMKRQTDRQVREEDGKAN